MKKWYRTTGSMCAAAILVGSIHGQEENAKEAEPIDQLAPFNVIGTKADVPNLKGSGAVLDSSDLSPFFHTDIHEILRQVPGVYVRPEEGYGFFPNISLRGVDPLRSRKTTIMEDGVPSEPSPYADPSAYYAPTAGRMAGFEILKGSSSLKHGPHNIGGVINYLSTPIPNEHRSHLRASYGDYNERISHANSGGKVDFGGGKLGYLLEVFDHRSDGWKTIPGIGGEPERSAPIARTDLLLKLGYEFGEDSYLEFKAGRMDLDADVSYQGVSHEDFLANPYMRYPGTNQDNMDAEQQRYYLRYIKEFNEDLTFTTTAYYNEFARNWYKLNDKWAATRIVGTDTNADGNADIWSTVVNGTVGARGTGFNEMTGVPGTSYKGKSNNRVYETKGIQANLDWQLGRNDFDLGFRYHDDNYYKLDYRNPTYTWGADGDGDGVADSYTYASTLKSGGPYQQAEAFDVYLVDEITFGGLTLAPGIRHTSVDFVYKAADKKSLSNTLWGLGANYRFSENLSVFGGLHQGQALPSAEGYIDDGVNHEESLQFEIGARGSISRLYYEAVYFNTQLDDMMFLASNAGGLDNSQNLGEGSTSGLELILGADLGGEGIGVPLSLSATFTDTDFESGGLGDPNAAAGTEDSYLFGASKGKSFAYIPDVQYNLRGGLEFESFRTYLNYHWQDSVFTTALNDHSLDSYGILDWSGFVDINDGVTIFAKVTNLADEEYAHSILPGGFRPGQPRIWSLGMSYDF